MVAFSGVFLSSCSELIPGLGMDASWRKKPLPPARLSMGQCLHFDPVLPAPTSILFARPLRPEVETNVGGGAGGDAERGSVFFLSPPPGTTTPPYMRPAKCLSLPRALCPFPRNGGWGRAGPN